MREVIFIILSIVVICGLISISHKRRTGKRLALDSEIDFTILIYLIFMLLYLLNYIFIVTWVEMFIILLVFSFQKIFFFHLFLAAALLGGLFLIAWAGWQPKVWDWFHYEFEDTWEEVK